MGSGAAAGLIALATRTYHFVQNNKQYQIISRNSWRKGWDSNPRYPCRHAGFQDRCLKPLGHPSGTGFQSLIAADVPRQCEVAAIEPGPASTVEEGGRGKPDRSRRRVQSA